VEGLHQALKFYPITGFAKNTADPIPAKRLGGRIPIHPLLVPLVHVWRGKVNPADSIVVLRAPSVPCPVLAVVLRPTYWRLAPEVDVVFLIIERADFAPYDLLAKKIGAVGTAASGLHWSANPT